MLNATNLENHRRSSSSATVRAQIGAQERQRLGAYGLGGLGPARCSPEAPVLGPPWLTRGRPGEVIVGSLGRGVARSRGPAPGDRLTPALCRSLTRTAGCCPCWSACASCSCHSSCCATSRRGPGCPFSSPRTPTSSPSCCSSLSQMVTSCPSPCAWRPGLGHGEARDGLGSREMGSVLERDSRQGFGFRPARPKLFLQASLVPPRQVRPSLLDWPQARS